MGIAEQILDELRLIREELQALRQGSSMIKPDEDTIEVVIDSQEVPGTGDTIDVVLAEDDIEPLDADEQESPTPENEKSVIMWLAKQGITVTNHHKDEAVDAVLDKFALYLGDHFDNLRKCYEALKRATALNRPFRIKLDGETQATVSHTTQFCNLLKKHAYLEEFKYFKDTRLITGRVNHEGNVQNFITGGWFERYVYQKIKSILTGLGMNFDILVNAQITENDGDSFELDVLCIVDGHPIWLECKTGDYQAHVTKYSRARKRFNIPKERAILVILNMDDDLAASLTSLHGITVTNEEGFLTNVTALLNVCHEEIED